MKTCGPSKYDKIVEQGEKGRAGEFTWGTVARGGG